MALVAAVIDWPKRARISIMARSAKRSRREAVDTTAVDLALSLATVADHAKERTYGNGGFEEGTQRRPTRRLIT